MRRVITTLQLCGDEHDDTVESVFHDGIRIGDIGIACSAPYPVHIDRTAHREAICHAQHDIVDTGTADAAQ